MCKPKAIEDFVESANTHLVLNADFDGTTDSENEDVDFISGTYSNDLFSIVKNEMRYD